MNHSANAPQIFILAQLPPTTQFTTSLPYYQWKEYIVQKNCLEKNILTQQVFLSICNVSGSVRGPRDTAVNNTDIFAFMTFAF